MQKIMADEVKRRGLQLIVSDMNAKAFCAADADLVLEIDTLDVEKHLAAADSVRSHFAVAGIVSFAHDAHLTAAVLASKYGLPSSPVSLSKTFHSKSAQRKMFSDAGVRQPHSESFCTVEGVISALVQELDRSESALIKWDTSSGSRGLMFVDQTVSHAELENIARQSVLQAPGAVIVEEFLKPETTLGTSEQSVEFVVVAGKVFLFNAVDRVFGADLQRFGLDDRVQLRPGVEFGHINPSSRTKEFFCALSDQAKKIISLIPEAWDSRFILKIDSIATSSGPVILEATLRSSGGWDSSASTPARGGRMHELVLDIALGNDVDVREYRPRDKRFVAVATNADSSFVNCIGRQFAIGNLEVTQSDAMGSAIESLKAERFL